MAPAVNYSACTAAGFPSRLERRPTAAFQWLRRRGPLIFWWATSDPDGKKHERVEAYQREQAQHAQAEAERQAAAAAEKQAAEQEALTAITPEQIALSDVTSNEVKSYDGRRPGWTLDGTVTNNSPDRILDTLKFEILVRDGNGPIIGQETIGLCGESGSKYISVPPGQARAFHSCVLRFDNIPPAKSPAWTYRIVEIRAGGHASPAPPPPPSPETKSALETLLDMYKSEDWQKACREQPGFDIRPDGAYDGSCPDHPRGGRPPGDRRAAGSDDGYLDSVVKPRVANRFVLLVAAFNLSDLEGETFERFAQFYSDEVIYYGKRMSRSDVIADKRRFMARWPTRNYIGYGYGFLRRGDKAMFGVWHSGLGCEQF